MNVLSRVVGAVAVVLLAGCASTMPERPISSFDAIAGEWVGTVYFTGGANQVQLAINKDGSWTAVSSNGNKSSGRLEIVNGKVISKNATTGSESDVSLREKGSERVLTATGKDTQGRTFATEFRPKK